jgi:HlyD family secretion protein
MTDTGQSRILTWIRRLAVELVVLIFVVGFFSQSFVNYSLPRVTSVPVFAGQLEKTYPIQGAVEYRDAVQVRLAAPVIIDTFFLDPGRRVTEGTPVFRINPAYGLGEVSDPVQELAEALEREKLELGKSQAAANAAESELALWQLDLENAQRELLDGIKLHDAGAISTREYEALADRVERLKLQVEMEELKREERRLTRELQVREISLRIASLEQQLTQAKGRQDFYARVNEEGIYEAEVTGLITAIAPLHQVLRPEDSLVEIALVNEEMEGLIYRGTLAEAHGKQFASGDLLDVNLEGVTEAIRIKITNLFYDAGSDVYRVEAQLMRDIPRQLTVRKHYRGEIVRKEQADLVVPRSAVNAVELRAGETGRVYLLETQEGILGQHHTARSQEITILSVGDQYISITGLEGFERPRVITPITHRVGDGVKVLHGY